MIDQGRRQSIGQHIFQEFRDSHLRSELCLTGAEVVSANVEEVKIAVILGFLAQKAPARPELYSCSSKQI